jgi:hypothetical protein
MDNRSNAKNPPRWRRSRISRGQSAVEFALISTVAMMVMLVGVQFALIGQAALAVSQGSAALARYTAVNPGALGTSNGSVAGGSLPTAAKNLLSSSIGTNSWGDLTVTIASYTGTTAVTTSSPGYTDRLVLSMSYTATSKIALPNPFFGISFPSSLTASSSQMYE